MKAADYKAQLNRAFYISFALGTLFIFIGGGSPAGWIGPVIVMVGYIVFGLSLSKKISTRSEFADSVYYLGFVFTMISLLSSTWLKLEVGSPDKILELFAIALITTIVGIVSRLGLSQFELTTDEQVENSNQRILDMVDEYIERLALISAATDEKSQEILESYDSLIASYTSQSENITRQFQSTLNEQSDNILKGISDNSENFKSSINEHTENITNDILSISLDTEKISKGYSEQINGMLNTLSQNVEIAHTNMEKIVSISDDVNTAINESKSGIIKSLDGINTNLEQNTAKSIDEFLRGFQASVGSLRETYAAIYSDLDSASSDAVAKINASMKIIETSLDGGLHNFSEIMSGFNEVNFDPNSFQDNLDKISSLNTTFGRTLSTLDNTYDTYVNRLTTLSETNDIFDAQLDTLRRLLSDMTEILSQKIQRR